MASITQERETVSAPDRPSDFSASQLCFDIGGERICIPIGTGPVVPHAAPQRSFAVAAGEIHGKLYRGLLRRFEQEGRDPLRFRKSLLRDLLSSKAIRADELEVLDEVVEITSRRGKGVDLQRLRSIFERLVDTNASPMAIAISSIAVNSGGVQEADGGTVAGADVGGGAAGGVLGGLGGVILVGAIASFGAAIGDNASG